MAAWVVVANWLFMVRLPAQITLLGCLRRAGVHEHNMLADDLPPPAELGVTVSLATDDMMRLSRGKLPRAQAHVKAIDTAVVDADIEPHHGKDMDSAANCTVKGVDVVDGTDLLPAAGTMVVVVLGLVHSLGRKTPMCTPRRVQTVLGHLTWVALPARPTSRACIRYTSSHGVKLRSLSSSLPNHSRSFFYLAFCSRGSEVT